jgi:hypothetical protein
MPVLASTELYDPAAGRVTPTGSMTTVGAYYTATLLLNGRVLIAGGDGCRTRQALPRLLVLLGCPDFCKVALTSVRLYDPSTGRFSVTGSMCAACADCATLHPGVVGGLQGVARALRRDIDDHAVGGAGVGVGVDGCGDTGGCGGSGGVTPWRIEGEPNHAAVWRGDGVEPVGIIRPDQMSRSAD